MSPSEERARRHEAKQHAQKMIILYKEACQYENQDARDDLRAAYPELAPVFNNLDRAIKENQR